MNSAAAAFLLSWVCRIVHSYIPYHKPRYVSISLVRLKGNTFLLLVFGLVSHYWDVSVIWVDWRDFFCITSTILADPTEPYAAVQKWKWIFWTCLLPFFFTFFSSVLTFLAFTETQPRVHEEISNRLTNGVRTSSWCSSPVLDISALASAYSSPRVSLIIMYGSLKMTTEFIEPAFLWLIATFS